MRLLLDTFLAGFLTFRSQVILDPVWNDFRKCYWASLWRKSFLSRDFL